MAVGLFSEQADCSSSFWADVCIEWILDPLHAALHAAGIQDVCIGLMSHFSLAIPGGRYEWADVSVLASGSKI